MINPADNEATIAAIATPPGPGGIGIIRVSGRAAADTLSRLFRPHRARFPLRSHRFHYGWIVDPVSGQPVDEVMAVFMAAPHTYTREDVAEIHCHGSYLLLEEILALILADERLRLAEPGEFTKRAFLNGRIDLTRAEAVIELLQARTKEGAHLAMAQLQGGLARRVEAIRQGLLALRAVLEVAIDFPEDEVEILDAAGLGQRLQQEVAEPLRELLALAGQGRLYREGIAAVIMGRPNVGKSSLLNCLLREERAIVTEVPGTTRDTIEEYLDIKGLPVRIIDTAGIRRDAGLVEELGIERSRRKLDEADLVLLLLDAAQGVRPEDRELFASVAGKSVILVINKIDLVAGLELAPYRQAFPEAVLAPVSARTMAGVNELEETIFSTVTKGRDWEPGHTVLPNLRHQAVLSRTRTAVARVAAGLAADASPDLLAVDLQEALEQLGEITGTTSTEEMLDLIFSRFCIGK